MPWPYQAPRTLGDVIKQDRLLRAKCRICRHSGLLPVEALAAQLGHDYPLLRLERQLRCAEPNCGRKAARVESLERGRG